MKKIILLICVAMLAFSLVACSGEEGENDKTSSFENGDYVIDFEDAASFESALNDGEKVNGKIVQFDVVEYKPDSALGINCWSGEHLNFISETELDVQKGDIIIAFITKEPSKTLGSWKIPYEVVEINPDAGDKEETDAVKTENTEEATTEEETTTEPETTTESETTTEPETTTEAETTTAPSSEYEKAYIREMSNYSLYMMFDEDSKKVVYFGTNDTYVMKGSYSGSFSSGVTISWDDGWDEKFTHSGGNSATLIDGNGFDWEYKVCDVEDAQEVLDDLN